MTNEILKKSWKNFLTMISKAERRFVKISLRVQSCKKKMTKEPSYSKIKIAQTYDAVFIIAAAMKKCGEDTGCIKNYLYVLKDYSGAAGTYSIDSNGDAEFEYAIKKYSDGFVIQADVTNPKEISNMFQKIKLIGVNIRNGKIKFI